MKFTERIKKLRGELRMPQRQLAAALEIDTATYCKLAYVIYGSYRAIGETVNDLGGGNNE